ncbi:hypothetical protein PM082_024535 [Marasmius tenuissimus]|nr:hypothetical protein PM082_024535 [Marasmius tenuissimus]
MSAPPATVEKRTKKPSAKVADPNNVANARSGKKKGAAKGAKAGQTKPFVPISREQLEFIMAQVKAGHALDPAAAGSQSQANTAATPGKKRKNTQQEPAVKKKAKQAVVSSDDEDVLDDILGARVEIRDSDSDNDANSNEEEDEDDENGAKVSSGEEGEEEEDVEPLNTMDEAAIANLSFEQLTNAWEGLKDDVHATNGIEEVEPEKGQSSSSGPVVPSTPLRGTSKGNKRVDQTPVQSLVPVALPSRGPGRLDRNGKPSHKINLTHFTPRMQRVVNLTRSEVRKDIALENAYPSLDSLEKYTWIRTLAELAVSQNRGDEEMMATIERNFVDGELKELFTAYAMYRRSGFMNNLTTKARNAIGGHYGIPGSNDAKTIAKRVAWLTNQGTFKFRSLNIEIFFSRGKADAAVFKALTRTQSIPGPIFALLSMAIEHALLQWKSGVETKTEFGDRSKAQYQVHLEAWNALEAKAPTYTQNLSKHVFCTSAEQTNKVFLLEEAMDEMSGIDFEGLEAMAKWEEEFPGRATPNAQSASAGTASASGANISPQTEGPAGPGEKATGTPSIQGTDQTALPTPAPGAPANPVPAAADAAAAVA